MEEVTFLRPTWQQIVREARNRALGLSRREIEGRIQKCYICGRAEIPLFNMLTPVYQEGVHYICSDHGGKWWNCFTGEWVYFETKPYWKRRLRNLTQSIFIQVRFIYFLTHSSFLWWWYG